MSLRSNQLKIRKGGMVNLERKTNIPKMAEEQLKIIQRMQKQIDGIQKLSNSNIVATMGVIEKMEPILGSISNFNECIKPIIDRQSVIKDTILASSIPTSALYELAIRQDILKSITAGNVYNLKSNLDVILENQTILAEAAVAASSMYARLDDIEKRHFKELDKSQTEEDIKEIEVIVGKETISKKIPYSYLLFVFFVILALVQFNESDEIIDIKSIDTVKTKLSPAIVDRIDGVIDSAVYDILKKGVIISACYLWNKISKNSKRVLKIDANQEIYIIGEERYYYKTIYHDEKGDLKEGYIAKRNVKIIENLRQK